MSAKLLLSFFLTLAAVAVSGFAQGEGIQFASDLRAKYGPPVARETYTIRPGVEIIVDYSVSGRVCRIQFPAMGPGPEPGIKSTRAIDALVDELVPLASRGKDLGTMFEQMSLASVGDHLYENVTIAEHFHGNQRTGVSVMFKKASCQDQRPIQ